VLSRFFAILAVAAAGTAHSAVILDEGSHCVAYRAKKVTMLVSSSYVVGKNCDVSAQVLPEVGGLYNIEVNIPVRSFNSGDDDRDKDVEKILRGEERPEITFRSKSMSAEEWRSMFSKEKFSIDGQLTIGSKSYPLKIQARYLDKAESAEVEGMAVVRFQDFEIRPPKVGAGLIASTKPDLELHFNLVSPRILGADAIRLEKEKSRQ